MHEKCIEFLIRSRRLAAIDHFLHFCQSWVTANKMSIIEFCAFIILATIFKTIKSNAKTVWFIMQEPSTSSVSIHWHCTLRVWEYIHMLPVIQFVFTFRSHNHNICTYPFSNMFEYVPGKVHKRLFHNACHHLTARSLRSRGGNESPLPIFSNSQHIPSATAYWKSGRLKQYSNSRFLYWVDPRESSIKAKESTTSRQLTHNNVCAQSCLLLFCLLRRLLFLFLSSVPFESDTCSLKLSSSVKECQQKLRLLTRKAGHQW